MSEFGNRLKKLRRDAYMTQGQLAEVLGVVPSAVGKYERVPNAYPSIEALIKIADYFNVSIDYLLRGTMPASLAENNVSGALMNSTVIQANHGGVVSNGEQTCSPEAAELLRIYDGLAVRKRLDLLNFAVDLEERSKVE